VLAAALLLLLLALTLALLAGSRQPAPPWSLTIATLSGLELAPGDGASAQQLLLQGSYRDPRWSPDDAWIGVLDKAGGIELVAGDGSSHRRVDALDFTWASVGADRSPRALVRRVDGTLRIVDPKTGAEQPVRDALPGTGALAGGPDRVAWAVGPEIYVADLDGGVPLPSRLLTRTARTSLPALAFSPDGSRIAFLAADCLGTCLASLSVIDIDGSVPQPLDGSVALGSVLSWDPTGSTILEVRDAGGLVIAQVHADDGTITPLLGSQSLGDPSGIRARWAAHGSAIVVEIASLDAGSPDPWAAAVQVLRMSPDGRSLSSLADDTAGGDLRVSP
jgi:hypothetical protein